MGVFELGTFIAGSLTDYKTNSVQTTLDIEWKEGMYSGKGLPFGVQNRSLLVFTSEFVPHFLR